MGRLRPQFVPPGDAHHGRILGLRRAGIVTSAWFTAGVAAIVAVLAGATTWATDGFWAPDGAYSLVISPAIAFIWIVAATRALKPSAEATTGW